VELLDSYVVLVEIEGARCFIDLKLCRRLNERCVLKDRGSVGNVVGCLPCYCINWSVLVHIRRLLEETLSVASIGGKGFSGLDSVCRVLDVVVAGSVQEQAT
jgi:hypothetical protein